MRGQRENSSRIAIGLAVGLGVFLSAGCTRRLILTPELLRATDHRITRLEHSLGFDPDANTEAILVYPNHPFVVEYERDAESSTTPMSSGVDGPRPLTRIKPSAAGEIIERGESNGMLLLWITFNECIEKSCAFGFVETEDDRIKLTFVPKRPYMPPDRAYKLDAVYKRVPRLRNIMRHSKVESLGEANEVYTNKRGRRAKTIYLEVVGRRIRPESRARASGDDGVGRGGARPRATVFRPLVPITSLTANSVLLHATSVPYFGMKKGDFLQRCRSAVREPVYAWARTAGLIASEREAFDSVDVIRFTLKATETETPGYFIVTFRFDDNRVRFAFEHRTTVASRGRQLQVARRVESTYQESRWEGLFMSVEDSMRRCYTSARAASE